jgi:acyl-coenzyme A thioesterase PaaI-like protein
MGATTHGLFLKALSALALGLSVAVGEVALYSEGQADLVAHATGTYSIPARGEAAS